ncbi:unnamed protein product, partial [Durusdinium trenchii]
VDLSYFAVDDQAPGEISIDDLFAGRPGICVCQAADAAGFLQTIAQRTVSEEASALLVIGELQGLSAWAQDKVTSLVVPVRVGGRPAAATAALFQTGDVPLAIPKQVSVSAKDDNAAKVTTLTFQVVVKLAQELPKPMTIRAYLKHLGLESHFLIQEVWSTGWFCKGKKCPETQADYYHGFMKFPDDRLSKLLRFSGRAGFFCNPRDASRGPDKRYKVIPVGGLQCSEALVKLRDFPQHAGLVKAKQGFGIRVPLAHYQAAKELFTPGAPQSSDSEVDGPRRFFVMGVPRSVDRSRLKSVLKEFHWKAEVIKSTGVQTWLVRASAPPPARAFQLDGVSVLISEDDTPSSAIVAGQLLSATLKKVAVGVAPATLPPVGSGAVSSVRETRLSSLESQLATLQRDVKEQDEQQGLRLDAISSRTAQLEHGVSQLSSTVSPLGQTVSDRLDQAFQNFEKRQDSQLADVIRRQSEMMQASEKVTADRLKFPVFSRETALVSAEVWESCRLLHVTVQAWDIPVHVLVMYLAPNAILGSLKYDSNCRIVAAAALLAERLMGPVLLVGDWNCPADSFEAVRLLGSNYGFADLAALWSERAGSPLEPTCAGATRHSFAFGNTEVQRFLGPVEVRHPFDLDKHAVLVVDVQFPRANPTVLRWLRPQPLADLVPDVERLSCLGGEVLPKLAESVRTSLAAHRPDEALLSWASTVEQVVCDAAEVDGRTRRAFVGRCSTDGPVAMNLAPPRVRFGRPGDVASPLLSLTLQQRRWLRQVRRRKALLKLLEALEVRGMLTGDLARVGALWRAVLASPGFGHSFAGWVLP